LIHILKSLQGRIETAEVEEFDFELLGMYQEMEHKMKQQDCHNITVRLDSGFQVMYIMPEKKE